MPDKKEEKAKKAAEAEFSKNDADLVTETEKKEEPVQEQVINPEVEALQKQIEELKSAFFSVVNQNSGAQVTSKGLVGTVEKYHMDPKYYPDPSDRLSKEGKLQRFAFRENYELEFQVTSTQYQTIDGINMKEPKFNLALNKVVFDEDTGEPTGGRYVIARAVFHEDPDAALVIARENGVEVDESNEKLFLDEMRYLRMRDWLVGIFYPPKSTSKSNRKEMVINGRVVDYFEINSENSESIPFGQLKGKVR